MDFTGSTPDPVARGRPVVVRPAARPSSRSELALDFFDQLGAGLRVDQGFHGF